MFSHMLDGIPIVGHVKAVGHLVLGDGEGAKRAFSESTRSTAVLAGGAVGCVGGPAGAVAGAMLAGALTDGVTSIATGKPQGILEGVDDITSDAMNGDFPLRAIVKTTIIASTDAVCGLGAGTISQAVKSVATESTKSVAKAVVKETIKTAAKSEALAAAGAASSRSLVTNDRYDFKSDRPRERRGKQMRCTVASGVAAMSATKSDKPSNTQSSSTNSGSNDGTGSTSAGGAGGTSTASAGTVSGTDSASAGGAAGQPPRDNENNQNNQKRRATSSPAPHMTLFLAIFNVQSLDDVVMGRSGVHIFRGLTDGQLKRLKKLLNNLNSDGYLEEVVKIVAKIFYLSNKDEDVTFQNFLSFVDFVATYIGEHLFERIGTNSDGSYKERRREEINNIGENIHSFATKIHNLFNQLRDDVDVENRQLTPCFRSIFAAVDHWYKHRYVPNGQYLSIQEYFEWIKKSLKKLKELKVYSQLTDDNNPRQVIKYEIYVSVFGRRVRIVLKIQAGQLELSSWYVVNVIFKGDEEGDEFIDDEYVQYREFH